MEPTKIKKLLIDCLKQSQASEGERAVVLDLLTSEDQQEEMYKFLSNNKTATNEEIGNETLRIYLPKKEAVMELGRRLKTAGVERDTALTVSWRLRKPGKAEEMISWLQQNQNVTPEEIYRKSEVIGENKPAKIHMPTPSMVKAREEWNKKTPEEKAAIEKANLDDLASWLQDVGIFYWEEDGTE